MADKVNIREIAETTSAKERFTKLDGDRTTVLDRARQCAKLTIPSILPDSGHQEETALVTPYQAVGSRLVNNLSAKLLLSLLPPNTPFFRLTIDNEVKDTLAALDSEQQTTQLAEIEKKLVNVEQNLMKQIEREALRVPIFEAIKSLVVTGNSLLYKTEEGLKAYKLDNYVIVRDFRGNVKEIIVKETLSKDTLPEDILTQLPDEEKVEGDIDLFTRAVKIDGIWYEYQTVNNVFVEGSDTSYNSMDDLPFIPLRWTAINGENYGRGLVEQYLGDFRSLEGLYQLLLEASAVSARVIFGVRPGSVTDIDELNGAENGKFIMGDLEQDLTVARVEKGSDLQIPLQLVQDLTRRLEQAFLVGSSIQRNAERVTAMEIRYMASDLEDALGGVYSILSLELQKPLALLLLKQSKINLKSLGIEAVIVTGIEALGRNNELDKLRQLNAFIQELGSPEILLQRLNIDGYIKAIGNGLGLDTSTLIKSEEQIQMEQQAQAEQQLMMQGASNMVNGATVPQQQ